MEMIGKGLELAPEKLRRYLDPARLPFRSTAEVAPLQDTIGQPRAIDAIEFALEIGTRGYNLFVAGAPGSGRESTVRGFLDRYATTRPAPPDWLYLHNFVEPDRPIATSLPAGQGTAFARAMDEFLTTAQREIPRAFDSETYESRRRDALGEITGRREALFSDLQHFAQQRSFALELTPSRIVSVPLADSHPLSDEEFERLDPEQRRAIEQRGAEIQARAGETMRQVHQLEKEAAERIRTLDRDVALFAVGPLLEDLRESYAGHPDILAHLDRVQNDLPDHLDDFRPAPPEKGSGANLAEVAAPQRADHLVRYRVNVFVDNGLLRGAPVVFERNPTYYNLTGRIDYRAAFGAMVTDFHQIKPGALHRANGGFLVMQAADVLRNPFTWEALKRSIQTRADTIENLAEQISALPTTTLRPAPIPLDLKVILIGSPEIFQTLYHLDDDFREIFRVKADFAPDMAWTDESVLHYAAFISQLVKGDELRHFDPAAVARVVEYGARLREHQGKLSTRLLEIGDLVTEASFWAGKAGHDLVQAQDVERAVERKEYRSNLVEERLREVIAERTIEIATEGARVGQVNGLSVLDVGDYTFGLPSRVSARVSLGRGTVQSIEREIEMSGPIHSKGVLILSGYLSGTYAQRRPLALAATLTFEQSYSGVDGDSASSTELYALLSALSGVPLKQGIAVTGSVNQYGTVQAVGGVTHKIEGFYAVCKARGLNGEQGVIIPAANVRHLMLSVQVVEAVRAGRFHIWAVGSIEEGLEVLTGQAAGERNQEGEYPAGSVHRLVEDRLRDYADTAQAFGASAAGHEVRSSERQVPR
jgi:lon-related putative ATP-dependent protease